MTTTTPAPDPSAQAEMFPALRGGKRPRQRATPRPKQQESRVSDQLDFLDRLLGVEPSDNDPRSWTLGEVESLHRSLLERSIEVLADTRSYQHSVQEILDWVSSTSVEGFSFEVCCRLSGYDPEEMREQLHFETRRLHDL